MSTATIARPDLGPVRPIRLLWLGVLAALKALGLVLVAEAVARGIAGVADGSLDATAVLALGVAGGVVRASAGWATQVAARRVATEVKSDLRAKLWRRIAAGGGGRHGGTSVLASEGLDDLDDYFTQSLPAMIAAVAVPSLVGLRILGADWVSAVIVVLTVPLVPVFMILIGKHTQDRTQEATGALTRLADHLAELARGLPVLVGLGRVEEQTAALERIQREYRERTMATLRTAFLSALALELIATLSVAVVAVFLGLRLMYGTVPLEAALVALILAPEVYSALREVGTAFHSSQAGLAALARVKQLLAKPTAPDVHVPDEQSARDAMAADVPRVRVSGLTVRYAGRDRAVIADLSTGLEGITAVTGPSGSGKSTLLAALAGVLPDDASVAGAITGVRRPSAPDGDPGSAPELRARGVAWAPQAPRAFATTPRDELALYGATDADGALDELGLAHVADASVAEISPGELRRLAVARALARVDAGATLLVLDEPTAHLDAAAAELVRAAIRRRIGRAVVVLASHEPETLALATRSVAVAAHTGPVPRAPHGFGDARSTTQEIHQTNRQRTSDLGDHSSNRLRSVAADRGPLNGLLRSAGWRWVGAIALGLVATALGLSLTAVSGWLIVRASTEEYIATLMVAIVGVRFFGLGRSVGRYAERLATHSAAFRVIDDLRIRMWRAIAARGAGSRRLLEGGSPVDYLVTQTDELRDQLPRTLPPIAVGVLAIAGVTITTWIVTPPLAPMVGAVLVAAAVAGAVLAVAAERGAGAAGVAERAEIVRGTSALASAADDLRGNSTLGTGTGPTTAALAVLEAAAARVATAEHRAARGAGLGAAVAMLAVSVLAAVIAPVAASYGLSAERVAVVALLSLAALEPVAGLVAAAQRVPALRAALRRIAPVLRPTPPALTGDRDVPFQVRTIEVDALAARYPGAAGDVFTGIDARVGVGEWLVVDGPSGAGKSTLLSVLMGALRPASGEVRANGVPLPDLSPENWRDRVAWCPQDAHVFDSTLRGNLLLARRAGDAPTDAELRSTLERAGLARLVAELPGGLDSRVGPAGTALSGGERQRLAVARALLSRADVLLLDEPSAHLDAPTAEDMMTDIRRSSRDRITVLVSHRPADRRADDRIVGLQGPAGAVAAEAREPIIAG